MEFLDIKGLERLLDNIKGYIDTKNYIDITTINHDDLVRLKDNSNLIPGKLYRITDYIITREDGSIKFAGHQFDIIVLALTKNTLSEEAWACKHDGDTYFENSNLSAWKIWYRIEGVGSKGVIYRMIDEFGNDCPYDFKNVMFKRYPLFDNGGDYAEKIHFHGIINDDVCWCYTFSNTEIITTNNEHNFGDASLAGEYECRNNKIMQSNNYNNVFIGTEYSNNILFEGCHDNTFGDCSNFNKLEPNCYYNLICGGDSEYNKLDYGCNNNKIMGSYNEIGKLSSSNILISCYSSKIGNSCDENIIDGDGNNVTITYGNNVKRTKLSGELNNIYINDNIEDIEEEINGSPNYNTKVGKNSNGDIKYYNEVDLMS